MVFTLTTSIVNVDLISISAYISQCKGKHFLKSQSLRVRPTIIILNRLFVLLIGIVKKIGELGEEL